MATYKNTRKKYTESKESPDKVEEIQAVYTINKPNLELVAAQLLGLNSPLTDDFLLIAATRKGIKKEALLGISKKMGLDLPTLCSVLHISTKTFQRLPEDSTLDIYSSEQAIELALVLAKASEIFSDENHVKRWFSTPLLALNGVSPVSLLDTGFGVKVVLQTLGRIEHGIYS